MLLFIWFVSKSRGTTNRPDPPARASRRNLKKYQMISVHTTLQKFENT